MRTPPQALRVWPDRHRKVKKRWGQIHVLLTLYHIRARFPDCYYDSVIINGIQTSPILTARQSGTEDVDGIFVVVSEVCVPCVCGWKDVNSAVIRLSLIHIWPCFTPRTGLLWVVVCTT